MATRHRTSSTRTDSLHLLARILEVRASTARRMAGCHQVTISPEMAEQLAELCRQEVDHG